MNKFVKTLYKMRYLPLLLVPLLVVMMVLPATLMAVDYGPKVNLGTTESFAVLAGETITNTGPTTIKGDVGLYPGSSFTGQSSVTMTGWGLHIANAVALQAKTDLGTAYDDAAGRTPVIIISPELGGQTLTPGVYASTEGYFHINTGEILTLNAQGNSENVFIFQTVDTLIAESGSNVALIGSAVYCRVFWKVGSSATLGTSSHFEGHIFALTSITARTGATVNGQLLARNGSVTLDTNTIDNSGCGAASIPTPITAASSGGILTIYKVDSSGNPIVAYTPALSAAFDIYANSADIGFKPPVQAGSIIKDTNFFRVSLQNGTYYVVEKSAPESYSIDSTVRTVTMSGGDATLTFIDGPTGKSASRRATETTIAPTETTPAPVTTTVTGGQIPKTSTPWYNVLIAGAALTLIGAMGWWITRKVHV